MKPKEQCPSLNYLRSKSLDDLSDLLRIALKEQINQLNSNQYQGDEDLDLLKILQKRLN